MVMKTSLKKLCKGVKIYYLIHTFIFVREHNVKSEIFEGKLESLLNIQWGMRLSFYNHQY